MPIDTPTPGPVSPADHVPESERVWVARNYYGRDAPFHTFLNCRGLPDADRKIREATLAEMDARDRSKCEWCAERERRRAAVGIGGDSA